MNYLDAKKAVRTQLKKLSIVENNIEFFRSVLHKYRQTRKQLIEKLEKSTEITIYSKKFQWYRPETMLQEYDLVAVIAFQERHEILRVVTHEIFKAKSYDLNIGLVLACSTKNDLSFAKELQTQFSHIGISFCKNHPLGNKWQIAVNCARNFNTKTLMITGSDDLISADYIYHNHLQVCNHDSSIYAMAGTNQWYMLDYNKNKHFSKMSLWKTKYKKHILMPLGAGRIYNTTFLDSVNWQIFDRNLESALDNKGFELISSCNKKTFYSTSEKGFILSIKGNWKAINPLNSILYETSDLKLDKLKIDEQNVLLEKAYDSINLIERIN